MSQISLASSSLLIAPPFASLASKTLGSLPLGPSHPPHCPCDPSSVIVTPSPHYPLAPITPDHYPRPPNPLISALAPAPPPNTCHGHAREGHYTTAYQALFPSRAQSAAGRTPYAEPLQLRGELGPLRAKLSPACLSASALVLHVALKPLCLLSGGAGLG